MGPSTRVMNNMYRFLYMYFDVFLVMVCYSFKNKNTNIVKETSNQTIEIKDCFI
jgi:hypothetical protein